MVEPPLAGATELMSPAHQILDPNLPLCGVAPGGVSPEGITGSQQVTTEQTLTEFLLSAKQLVCHRQKEK